MSEPTPDAGGFDGFDGFDAPEAPGTDVEVYGTGMELEPEVIDAEDTAGEAETQDDEALSPTGLEVEPWSVTDDPSRWGFGATTPDEGSRHTSEEGRVIGSPGITRIDRPGGGGGGGGAGSGKVKRTRRERKADKRAARGSGGGGDVVLYKREVHKTTYVGSNNALLKTAPIGSNNVAGGIVERSSRGSGTRTTHRGSW